jgi:hypothetical protein
VAHGGGAEGVAVGGAVDDGRTSTPEALPRVWMTRARHLGGGNLFLSSPLGSHSPLGGHGGRSSRFVNGGQGTRATGIYSPDEEKYGGHLAT